MTQHWMFIIWGYVSGVVVLSVLPGRPLVVNLGNYRKGISMLLEEGV